MFQDVPQGNPGVDERRASSLVLAPRAHQLGHDGPERVLRMGIVLALGDRAAARQTAQDQDARIRSRDGRKAPRYTRFLMFRPNNSLPLQLPTQYKSEVMKNRAMSLGVLLMLLDMDPLAAHDKSRRAECAEIKQKIRSIESKMRAGYTRARGLEYEERLRKLRDRRFRACR